MDKILELLAHADHVEVSKANKMWQKILSEIDLPFGESTLQVTGYYACSKFLEVLESALRTMFNEVRVYHVDDKPWRRIFLIKGEESDVMICASWYHTGPDF